MDLKQYEAQEQSNRPPSLVAGNAMKQIDKIEHYTFPYQGEDVKAIRIFADGVVFTTTGKVIIEKLTKYFEKTTEPMTNVKVVETLGQNRRKYLDIVGV